MCSNVARKRNDITISRSIRCLDSGTRLQNECCSIVCSIPPMYRLKCLNIISTPSEAVDYVVVITISTVAQDNNISTCTNGYVINTGTACDGATRCAGNNIICLLYTSPSPRDATLSRMPSSA